MERDNHPPSGGPVKAFNPVPDGLQDRAAAALLVLQAGYDPSVEESGPRRSDAWCLALGLSDAIAEECFAATVRPAGR